MDGPAYVAKLQEEFVNLNAICGGTVIVQTTGGILFLLLLLLYYC